MKKPSKKHNLVVVAHPDDETLFFGGLILSDRRYDWYVICVTDGNADGLGHERHEQFAHACRALGVRRFEFLDMPDRYEQRLSQDELCAHLRELRDGRSTHTIFTHGPLGEYGHPHHQDVSLAVHETFGRTASVRGKVWGTAYNCVAERIVKLSPVQFKKKADIIAKTYFGETSRFIQYLPATCVESFAQFELREVRSLHNYLSDPTSRVSSASAASLSDPPAIIRLDKYNWFRPYLASFRGAVSKRPF